MTTKTKKSNKNAARSPRTGDERATNAPPVRYAFAPILREFRAHTRKNEARLWVPIETNLISRYAFAACSLQTRYIFVAIVLYCAGNGIDEIPLDAKFMANVLVADERTIAKSFDELLFRKLLQERIEREEKKEQTDRQDAEKVAPDARVSVSDFNSFQEVFQNQNESENGLLKLVSQDAKSNGNVKHSQFSIEECLKYVELEIGKGATIQNPKALASKLSKTGEADSFIKAALHPEQFDAEQFGAPREFTDEPCAVCFGAKMANANGKGFGKCEHCKDERGKSTGKEPKGEINVEES